MTSILLSKPVLIFPYLCLCQDFVMKGGLQILSYKFPEELNIFLQYIIYFSLIASLLKPAATVNAE